MSRLRIIFCGSSDFAVSCLQACYKDEHYEIVAVVTQPDKPAGRNLELTASEVKKWALQNQLNVFTPESINTSESLEYLKLLKAEIAVVVAYGQILSENFLQLFPLGAVNVHGSLLPKWRGAAPIQRALMAGDTETGVSLQKIVRKLDAGAVIAVRKMALNDDMHAKYVYDQLKQMGAELMGRDLMDYMRGNLHPVEQDETLVSIAAKIKKEEALIDWNKSAREILNQYRGLKIWPGIFCQFQSKNLKIHDIKIVDEVSQKKAGSIVFVDKSSLHIACGQGSISLLEVQPESRAKMKIADFLNSKSFKVGDSFT